MTPARRPRSGIGDGADGGEGGGDLPKPRDDGRTVTYTFPIEVIVVGALTEEDQREMEERLWSRFIDALSQLP